ncbi:MAG: glycoside hydrolase family 20 zincin-like fold domain-containing protein [Armatimonadota bacterium]
MRLADTMPFSTDLRSPIWTEIAWRPGARPAAGDVTIDGSWVVMRQSDEPAAVSASDVLTDVLRLSYCVPMRAEGEREIRLRVDEGVGRHPEAHRLSVSADRIEIAGASAVGVLHGTFRLIALMRERGGPFVPQVTESRSPLFRHRVHRSALSPFYVEELTGYVGPPFESNWKTVECTYPAYIEEDAGPDQFYHENVLLRLAMHGFNGIWLRGALRKFARNSAFPEFGEDAETICGELRRLCRRAARFGMKVFLYLNEPMGIDEDDPFWESYPHVRGPLCHLKPVNYLCSSTAEVKTYLRESAQYVFENVPELAGVLLITASEYPSHCWCHTRVPGNAEQLEEMVEAGTLCPRCAERTPQEVIGEIVGLLREGIRAAKPEAEVVAWNWSWSMYEEDPQRGVLEALPDDVIVMGDYERGQMTEACGFEYKNDEYSIKVIGPSPRFTGVAEFQRERGLPVYAKLQIGTTHENPDIPYLPTLQKIARKWQTLVEAGVTGMMTCWNFGNMPSLATELAGEMTFAPQPSVEEALMAVATRHFGEEAAESVVAGWQRLCAAQDDFPTSIPVMYYGPISRGPAFHFIFDQVDQKFPRSWMLDTNLGGDHLDWVSPFGAEKVLECFRTVAERWAEGVEIMRGALPVARGAALDALQREIGVSAFCLTQLISAGNVVEFLLARDAFHESGDDHEKRALLDAMEQVCRAEIDNAHAAMPLCDADSRLGWHGEAYGYMINRELIEAKLAGLRELLNERIPEERAKLL